jgi:hypothetical protein
MAKQDFLENFRIARNLFFHPRVETDSPTLDPVALERTIARAAIWLTPRSVRGFNADDFAELGPDRQRELQATVQRFLAVANQVPPNQPATPEQLAYAQATFTRLVEILQPYLPSPQEGAQIEAVLKSVAFPHAVVNWDYELGSDQDDSPAVWVNLYVDEDSVPPRELGRLATGMTKKILDALAAAGSPRWPYIRVRSAVQHKIA